MWTVNKEKIKEILNGSFELREKLLSDPFRPGYHFAFPGDYGLPGDPNGAFYANGRYHLMFLYWNRKDFVRYGHLSSTDLVHWRMHPDAIGPDEFDGGIFSGGAFVDADGTAYLSYWGVADQHGKGATGLRIAYSKDIANHYEKWEKMPEYAVPGTSFGIREETDAQGHKVLLGNADPSNIWKAGDTYYMQAGALVVLNQFRDRPDAPNRMLGDWTELYASKDLKHWEHRGRFYQRREDDLWTDKSEDDMCPSFLPLPKSPSGGDMSGKYLQLFIAHNKGAQYYIGSYDPSKEDYPFTPEKHGRMSWQDPSCFAPEALIDGQGRQIMWAWFNDDLYSDERELSEFGWCGVYTLPRTLWMREDGTLGQAPVPELEMLRYGETDRLDGVDSRSCEIFIRAEVGKKGKTGLRIRLTRDEYLEVYYDAKNEELVYDATHARVSRIRQGLERAPLKLNGDKLRIRIFIDRAAVEVFANEKQAISRRTYWNGQPDRALSLIADDCTVEEIKAWNMMESNPF